MTVWIPKGEFPSMQEDYSEMHGNWQGNILAYRTEIRQKAVIHLENLYRYMYYYLTEEGWVAPDGSKDYETYYFDLRKQTGERADVRIWWRMEMGPGFGPGGMAGIHPFLKYKLNIDFLCHNVKRIEMVHQGRKVKPFIGDVTVWIVSILELDYCGWFEKSGIMDIIKEYFVRRIYKRNIREHEVELRRITTRYAEDFKHFIGMLRPSEERKMIHPQKGFY
ncbi:hypothetical protein GF327_07085 [Candidatus Woesearchaeota archaeon]|nr:hypothetical protein [Candidatus Woesearchaeota archaeon]